MSRSIFTVMHSNPNDATTGACVCSTSKVVDCKPPFAVFHAQELMDARAPAVVVCQACAVEFCRRTAAQNPDITDAVVVSEPGFDAKAPLPHDAKDALTASAASAARAAQTPKPRRARG